MNQPALTGMQPDDVTTLAAALDIPYRARLEHKAYLQRGGRRVTTASSSSPHGNRKPDVTGHVLAVRLRDHPHLPMDAIGALLGADRTSISHSITITRALIAENRIPVPAAAPQASEILGESPANCAFHLRTVAKYGFVEEAGGGRGRERPWRQTYDGMSRRTRQEDPQSSHAAEALDQVWMDRLMTRAQRSLTSLRAWPDAFGDGLGVSASRVYVTPQEAIPPAAGSPAGTSAGRAPS